MRATRLRSLAGRLRHTPLHPQWHVFREERRTLRDVARHATGLVVDVGCGHQAARTAVGGGGRYVGLDHYRTASEWYGSTPDVFGDAQRLPVRDGAADTILLLDVLEHLPAPDACLAELHRVLAPGGCVVVQVPFLYPVHDAPLDFGRWTEFGLRRLLEGHGFEIVEATHFPGPAETGAMLLAIGLARHVLAWAEQRRGWALLGLALPVVVAALNLGSWLVARVSCDDALMPAGYRLLARKA